MAANGDAEAQTGMAAHVYLANRSMERRAFVNADGEMLLVPQQGRLRDHHRAGRARRQARRDRAAAARHGVQGRAARRPVARLRLRELRRAVPPARARARSAPTAWPTRATSRRRWRPSKTRRPAATRSSRNSAAASGARRSKQSPFNVVAWHGNLAPVKYDTAQLHDHRLDQLRPSRPVDLHRAAPRPRDTPGTANCDFVIFPPRWLVMEDTFRPPWYHRNLMSEFMGLVLRRVRRQARAASSPAAPACTTAWCRTAPTRRRSRRPASADLQAAQARQHAGLHVREPLPLHPHRLRAAEPARSTPTTPTAGPASRTNSSEHDHDASNATHDPALRSWVASANEAGCDFPIQNLPFGRFRRAGSTKPCASASRSATRCSTCRPPA